MKFEKGKVYTHRNMLDMVVYVMYDFMPYEDYVKLRIRWFNRRGLNINQEETITIMNKDANDWYEWNGKTV